MLVLLLATPLPVFPSSCLFIFSFLLLPSTLPLPLLLPPLLALLHC
jgi:hypothetical protein